MPREFAKLIFRSLRTGRADSGYPGGLRNPKLFIATQIKPVDGLDHPAAVQYDISGDTSGVRLPESYNGLGFQNLISMVFQLMRFRDDWMQVGKFKSQVVTPDDRGIEPLQLVLIEEPEAHLHVQVQQVFMARVHKVLRNHEDLKKKDWRFTTQLIVSTHSGHIAHAAAFEELRYFKRELPSPGVVPTATVANMKGLFGKDTETHRFVTRYLLSTHFDLFFADAIIVIEGAAERILLPHLIQNHYPDLAMAYLSFLELGGSHAHRMRPLIEALEVPTLIITDLDAVAKLDKDGKTVTQSARPRFEASACEDMARITGDPAWQNAEAVKTLTIERHMAAARLGFSELFEPLSKPDKLKDGFRDGTLPALRLFTHRVLPLVTAQKNEDAFAAMEVLRAGSPLVDKRGIRAGRGGQATGLDAARAGVAALMTLFKDERDPSCAEVLAALAGHQLFPIPDQLRPCLPDNNPMAQYMTDILAELGLAFDEQDLTASEATPPTETTITEAWTQALEAPFSQVGRYLAYVEDRSPYGTHQGVKGLEFPRVMVIADDVQTRFKGLASYETLFGVKPLGADAQKKADKGEETTIERTRRLLYVTCTRAEESLALVLYSEAPDTIRGFLISNGWMAEDEVVMAAADGTYQEAALQR